MKRYHSLDGIRGITLCSMLVYHGVWDLVYMFGYDWQWYRSDFAYWWQQSICWSFILLSGFCFNLGNRKWYRGLVVFGSGAVISLVTQIFMPGQSVRFGVLTLLGSAMLWMTLLENLIKIVCKKEKVMYSYPVVGLLCSGVAFFITRDINERYLGFEGIHLSALPDSLYRGESLMTYLGFMGEDFYSTDYFSLMPWFFLFLVGYFLYWVLYKKNSLNRLYDMPQPASLFCRMGRHSLLIYMLHQPVLYLGLTVVTTILSIK